MKKILLVFVLIFSVWVAPGYAGFKGYLIVNTATTINITLVKTADGTGLTGATVANISMSLLKQSDTSSATTVDLTLAASGSTHDCVAKILGNYNVELTTTDTNTLGRLDVVYAYANCYTLTDSYYVIAYASDQRTFAGNVTTVQGFLEYPQGSIGDGWARQIFSNTDIPTSSVPTEVWDYSIPEPTIPLSASNSAGSLQAWLKVWTYNKLTVTNTLKTYFNDAGSAIGSATLDNGATTYTQDKVQ